MGARCAVYLIFLDAFIYVNDVNLHVYCLKHMIPLEALHVTPSISRLKLKAIITWSSAQCYFVTGNTYILLNPRNRLLLVTCLSDIFR